MHECVSIPATQPPEAGTRRCTKCGDVKAVTEFYRKNKTSEALRSECKRCIIGPSHPRIRNPIPWLDRPGNRRNQNIQRRKNYSDNRERFRAEARAAHYKHREKKLARLRKHYAENREELAAKALVSHKKHYATARAWKKKNPDKIRQYNRSFAERNPGHHIPYRNARRARKRGLKCERIKPWVSSRLSKWQGGLCVYCRINLDSVIVHQDHIIPLAKGGEHSERNLQLTCSTCNLRKHDKWPLDFAAEMGIVKNPLLIAI